MRLEDLHTLLNIQRYGSINKAAQNSFLSHSSLMYVLQSVEKEVGYPIFIRSKQGVTPTVQGAQLLADAQVVLDITDKWFGHSTSSKAPEGTVPVTLMPAIAKVLAMDLLVHLRTIHPKLTVHLTEKKHFTTTELINALKNESSRIFVGTLAPSERSVFEVEILKQRNWSYIWKNIDSMALHLSTSNPLAARKSLTYEDLSSLPMLFYPDSGKKFGFTEVVRKFPQKQVYNISMSDSVLELTAGNEAVVLASKLITQTNKYVQSGTICTVPIEGHPMPMSYYIIFPSNASQAEKAVLSRIIETFDRLTGDGPDSTLTDPE